MRAVLASILAAMALSGCLPMALFADGSSSEYNGYRSSFGTYVASSKVNTFCIAPKLWLAIWEIEGHFGKKVVMNSGFRTPWHNYAVGGAENSYHTKCMAADIKIPGVAKSNLIAYARTNGLVGGLGCYPGRDFIHIDVRDRPRGHSGPVTFAGC